MDVKEKRCEVEMWIKVQDRHYFEIEIEIMRPKEAREESLEAQSM